jgi:ketosteroid isomerase-like protein
MKGMLASLPLLALLIVVPRGQDQIPDALRAMADAEREFARTATVKGVRDAFLDFFADDAIALTPAPVPAKDGLRKQPSRPFSESGIIWEPRTGDVAASGEIGWLTGPATFTSGPGQKPTGYGCYLSVWRMQPDGRWRVFIDIGVSAPEQVSFAPGFTRTTVERRYRGSESQEVGTKTLLEADRALNQQITASGPKGAYASVLASRSRLHRPGRVPMVGVDPILSWLAANSGTMTAETGSAESSRSADVGYSYGAYHRKGEKPESGPYVRLWSRDQDGRWWLIADVAHPAR